VIPCGQRHLVVLRWSFIKSSTLLNSTSCYQTQNSVRQPVTEAVSALCLRAASVIINSLNLVLLSDEQQNAVLTKSLQSVRTTPYHQHTITTPLLLITIKTSLILFIGVGTGAAVAPQTTYYS